MNGFQNTAAEPVLARPSINYLFYPVEGHVVILLADPLIERTSFGSGGHRAETNKPSSNHSIRRAGSRMSKRPKLNLGIAVAFLTISITTLILLRSMEGSIVVQNGQQYIYSVDLNVYMILLLTAFIGVAIILQCGRIPPAMEASGRRGRWQRNVTRWFVRNGRIAGHADGR